MKLEATAIATPATDDEVPIDPIKIPNCICVGVH